MGVVCCFVTHSPWLLLKLGRKPTLTLSGGARRGSKSPADRRRRRPIRLSRASDDPRRRISDGFFKDLDCLGHRPGKSLSAIHRNHNVLVGCP